MSLSFSIFTQRGCLKYGFMARAKQHFDGYQQRLHNQGSLRKDNTIAPLWLASPDGVEGATRANSGVSNAVRPP